MTKLYYCHKTEDSWQIKEIEVDNPETLLSLGFGQNPQKAIAHMVRTLIKENGRLRQKIEDNWNEIDKLWQMGNEGN